jgi:hypothetical protein
MRMSPGIWLRPEFGNRTLRITWMGKCTCQQIPVFEQRRKAVVQHKRRLLAEYGKVGIASSPLLLSLGQEVLWSPAALGALSASLWSTGSALY